jgi:AAA family ATP:ADP antiporter
MNRWIERALNIHPGDLGRGFLLSSCLFLTISAYVLGKVARDALFLSQFQAIQLPYADIASGVLVGFIVIAYLRLGKRASLGSLLIGTQLFFASNCILFWFLARRSHPTWLYPVIYIWVGSYGVLAPTQVWSLANFLLTTREAKRIFGMVGGGAIFGWIFAGYLSRILTQAFGAESLLVGMTFLLVLCSASMAIASKGGQFQVSASSETAGEAAENRQEDFRGVLRSVFSSPYLRAVAAVICISSLATTLTGWQFKALAKQFSVNKDAMAIFFGDFYFYAGILSLLFQLFVTTRLLRRFGIGPMLFLLPIVVLCGSTGLLILGTIASALFLKGGDQVVRYSIDRSTVELLYLPLPRQMRLEAKWLIDTVVWRLGDGLGGLVVLIFAANLHLSPQQISWVALLVTGVWIFAVFITGKQYVSVLEDCISRHRFDAEQASTLALDRSTAELLTHKIQASDSAEILYALSLFEVERERAAHPVIRALLSHPSPEVRQKAISILSAAGDEFVRPTIERLLKDPDHLVRTEAMLYLVYHDQVDPLTLLCELGDFADFCVRSAVAAYLARPGEAQSLVAAHRILEEMSRETGEQGQRTRIEVARLLGELPDNFDQLLTVLLRDPDVLVVREAIRSVGKLENNLLAPMLLDFLGNRELAAHAAEGLAKFGDRVVPLLRNTLADSSLPIEVRKTVPPILVSIGTTAAARALTGNLMERDASLRLQIISALNRSHQVHPEIELDTQFLETVLAAEILGHYRSYQILEALNVPRNTEEQIAHAVEQSMKQELERIFRLLGLLYPRLDLHSVYFGLQSTNTDVYDNSLEFLESVLKSQLRGMLLPLLDGKVSARERAALGERVMPAKIENRDQAVATLILSDDPWLKSCGAYAIGMLGIKSLETELNRCLEHPDPLLRETARAAKLKLEAPEANP